MPLPAGVEKVTVSSGQPLTLPDGTAIQGKLYFSGPDVVTIAGQDVLLGGEVPPVELVNGAFSVDLVATDATGMSPSGWTYTVRAVLTNAPSWTRYISLPKATPSVKLADVVVPDPVAGEFTALVDPSTLQLDQDQVTGLLQALAALLPLAGGTLTGDLTINGHNLTVKRADGAGAYRLRVTGGGLDFEIGGLDVTVSTWTGADFTGTQSNVMRWEPAGPHLIGRTQYGTSPFDTVHDIDAGTGVAALGAKNGLLNLRFCGRRTSTGAPTSGTWATGDTVQDSAGALWLCTAGGIPGTWVGGAASKPWVFDVTAYGARGDGQVVTDGAMSSGSAVLTSATAAFTSADVGKAVLVKGAGGAGVTTLVTTIASRQSATQVTLSATNASGGAVSGALVMWATDDTTAVQSAINAATTHAQAHGAATVYVPVAPNGRFYGIAGALVTGGSTLGNAQLTLPVIAATANKVVLTFEGQSDGAALQHWQQTVPQMSGSTLVSFKVHASSSAQIALINAAGNSCVLGGPSQPGGYGVAPGVFSNMHVAIRGLSILTTHSANGLTLTAVDLSGVANASLDGFAYGTCGTVAGGDYASPGSFANGLCPGLLLPASGNNDLVLIRNTTCHGGYTYGIFATEHADVYGMRILYCWAGFCPVGTYYGSVGSTHAIVATLLSIESCTYIVYIIGGGSGGIGPFLHLRIDTETGLPRFGDNNSGFASSTARGDIVLTGLYTAANLTLDAPIGYDIIDGQRSYPAIAKSSNYTVSTFDELVSVDASGAGRTVTLPTAVGRNRRVVVTKVDSSGNTVTIATTGGQTINGTSTKVLSAQWATAELLPTPAGNWIAR